jgi:hypothetical protein
MIPARTASRNHSAARWIRTNASGVPPTTPVQNTRLCIVITSTGRELASLRACRLEPCGPCLLKKFLLQGRAGDHSPSRLDQDGP